MYICKYRHVSCESSSVCVSGDGKAKRAHPLDVELYVLLRAALDLLLHFPHRRLHVDDALLVDAAQRERERARESREEESVNRLRSSQQTYLRGKAAV